MKLLQAEISGCFPEIWDSEVCIALDDAEELQYERPAFQVGEEADDKLWALRIHPLPGGLCAGEVTVSGLRFFEDTVRLPISSPASWQEMLAAEKIRQRTFRRGVWNVAAGTCGCGLTRLTACRSGFH